MSPTDAFSFEVTGDRAHKRPAESNRAHLRRVITNVTGSHAATRRSLSPFLFVILAALLVAGRPAAAQSLPSGVYRAGDDGVTFPRAVREVAPGYPIEAMRAGVHGTVRLEVIVGARGRGQAAPLVKLLYRKQ